MSEIRVIGINTATGKRKVYADGDTIQGAGGTSTWGSITGTLSSQTDLQGVLDGKTTLATVKADSDISDAITKKHSNTLDHANSLDHDGSVQDTAIAGKLASTSFSGLTKITVGTTQPTSPNVGDLWIDTN